METITVDLTVEEALELMQVGARNSAHKNALDKLEEALWKQAEVTIH